MRHHKILFSLLFLFLAFGFLFFNADFVQGASGTCHCVVTDIANPSVAPAIEDFSADEADCASKTDSATGWAYDCSWKALSGKCICDIVSTETGDIEPKQEVADKSEEQCNEELEETEVEGGGGHYQNCSWDISGVSSGEAPSGGTTGAALDIPSVAGLNQLENSDVKVVFGNIIKVAMGLMGSIALALFAYAGVLWMLSGGNAEQATKARNILVWATMGLFVILASYTIVSFIFSAVE